MDTFNYKIVIIMVVIIDNKKTANLLGVFTKLLNTKTWMKEWRSASDLVAVKELRIF